VTNPSPRLRGEVRILPLDSVQPNSWNPNTMTPDMRASLRHGLVQDGWLVSQALLVWGADQYGEEKMLIIDGEHRWEEARALGMSDGPMVVLNGIGEADAKALTVKLNQKRGVWNEDALAKLLQEISAESRDGISGIDLGFADEQLMKLLAETPAELPAPPPSDTSSGPSTEPQPRVEGEVTAPPPEESHVRMVQLFLDDVTQPVFMERIKKLSERYGTKNVTDTVMEAVRRAEEFSDALGELDAQESAA
jgi:hypothetical protein